MEDIKMRHPKRLVVSPALTRSLAFGLLLAGMLLLAPGCSVSVKKDSAGEEKNVDIRTPVGNIHVGEDGSAADIGLPVYPGAREKSDQKNGNQNPANVNISTDFFRLKVVAIEYESDDDPDKLIAYYQDKLKKYGNVLECHSSGDGKDIAASLSDENKSGSLELKCEGNSGSHIELKAGNRENQHLVAIAPASAGKGSSFSLVSIQTRGKQGSI
jgi:hypothetical protein